jgi:hypothetical protein
MGRCFKLFDIDSCLELEQIERHSVPRVPLQLEVSANVIIQYHQYKGVHSTQLPMCGFASVLAILQCQISRFMWILLTGSYLKFEVAQLRSS